MRPFVYYEGIIAHEFGHVMGLKDMYAGAECNHGYEPESNAELEYVKGGYGMPGAKGIMKQNGSAVLNDIEMILQAFKEKQWQYYVPYGNSQWISLAISSKPRYIKGNKTYKWNSTT